MDLFWKKIICFKHLFSVAVTLTFQPWALIYLRTPKWIKEQLDYLKSVLNT